MDSVKTPYRYHYNYIHNCFAHFFKDSLDYFTSYLYPRFQFSTITTYDKPIEYFLKKQQYGREIDKPQLPALILNPNGDFNLSDTGKQFFRFPNYTPGMITRLFPPIYQDSNVIVTLSFMRVSGEFDLICLLNSFYEYADVRVLFIQIFGGEQRVIYPTCFNTFVIIPDDLYNFEYNNDVTNINYILDWDSAGVKQTLVKTINTNQYIYPLSLRPWYKMNSISDGSEKLGGLDKLSEWKLTVNVQYEVELPVYLVLREDYLSEGIVYETTLGSTFSQYDYSPPETIKICNSLVDYNIDTTSSLDINNIDFNKALSINDGTGDINYSDLIISNTCDCNIIAQYNNRYTYMATLNDSTGESDIDFSIPEYINNSQLIILNSRYGPLTYGNHYTIYNIDLKSTNILIYKDKIDDLVTDQLFEVFTYYYD